MNDKRMAVHCLELGCFGLYIPSDLKIYLGPKEDGLAGFCNNCHGDEDDESLILNGMMTDLDQADFSLGKCKELEKMLSM